MTRKKRASKAPRRLPAKVKKVSLEELREIGRKFRKHIRGPLVDDHAELLYDENGLPK